MKWKNVSVLKYISFIINKSQNLSSFCYNYNDDDGVEARKCLQNCGFLKDYDHNNYVKSRWSASS